MLLVLYVVGGDRDFAVILVLVYNRLFEIIMEFSEETNVNSGSVDRRNNNELNKEHPLLYLVKMFRFESMEVKTYKFTCLLCKPKATTCSAAALE